MTIDKLADPSNVAVPVTAPDSAIVRGVNNRDAVVAFPLTLPVSVAVIVFAAKSPDAFRVTMEFPIFVEMAAAGAVPSAIQVTGATSVNIQNVFVLISHATLPLSVMVNVVTASRAAAFENSHL